ncbi:hypothetical protein AB0425_06585 [Actinosynnema sp. NPDC051121]
MARGVGTRWPVARARVARGVGAGVARDAGWRGHGWRGHARRCEDARRPGDARGVTGPWLEEGVPVRLA